MRPLPSLLLTVSSGQYGLDYCIAEADTTIDMTACRRRLWRMTSRLTRRITSTQPHLSTPIITLSPPHSEE